MSLALVRGEGCLKLLPASAPMPARGVRAPLCAPAPQALW